MFHLILIGMFLFGVRCGVTPNHQSTNTGNCYYTFVVPRDLNDGNSGPSATELHQLRSEVTDLRRSLTDLLNKVNGEGGNVHPHHAGINFVNWGRTVCPQNSSVIYQGYAAKTLLTNNGGGVDYQCLPETPEWTGNEVGGLQTLSYIHGVQYWADSVPDIFPNGDKYNDMPCAVCDAPHVTQSLMIPAKISCPAGWSKMYQGILMAERTASHHESPSNYICVDKDYEFTPGGVGGLDSGYVVPVEVTCGVIPCGPYVEGYELSCVVCAK